MLDLAISSMALAVFSRTQNHPLAAREASLEYCQLLQLMRTTMPALNETNIDNCLLAIYCMSRYEDVLHCSSRFDQKTPFLTSLQSLSHHDGALAILKEWKNNLSHYHPATNIIKHTRRGLIRSALLRNLALPAWMLKGDLFGEHGLDLEYDSIIACIVNVRHDVSALVQESSRKMDESEDFKFRIEKLNQEAQSIDKALRDWATHFPSEWSYQRYTSHHFKSCLENDFHSQIVYIYSNPAYGSAWNHYFATAVLINSTRIRILDLSPSKDDSSYRTQRLECFGNIESMAADLAASLPVSLQRANVAEHSKQPPTRAAIKVLQNVETKAEVATLSAWPLTLVSSIEHLGLAQKSRFRSELAHLGKVVGDGVLQCAESSQWLKL